MKQFIYTTILLIIIFGGDTLGQSSKPILLGIQPSITIEPFYEEGELDVNVFPFVFEIPVAQQINFRLVPTLNYHFGGEKTGISDVGFYSVLPIFFRKKESVEVKPYGFYVGPVLGFGRNILYDHYTITLAVEPGYLFEAKKSFTISLGFQVGSSYFAYDSQPNKWIFHWGPKITFGFWLQRNTKNSKTVNQ